MYTTIPSEYKSPDFSVTYDPKYDVVRLRNKSVDHYSYDEIKTGFYLMIDDETNEIIGAQVLNFIRDNKEINEIIESLEWDYVKSALIRSYVAIQK